MENKYTSLLNFERKGEEKNGRVETGDVSKIRPHPPVTMPNHDFQYIFLTLFFSTNFIIYFLTNKCYLLTISITKKTWEPSNKEE